MTHFFQDNQKIIASARNKMFEILESYNFSILEIEERELGFIFHFVLNKYLETNNQIYTYGVPVILVDKKDLSAHSLGNSILAEINYEKYSLKYRNI